MASQGYDEGTARLLARSGNTIDWLSDTIKVLLLSTATPYTPSKAHVYVADVLGAGSEVSTTNYARKTLASKTQTKDGTNHQIVLSAANVTWTALGPSSGGPTIAYIVAFKLVTNDADSPVICVLDPTDVQVNGGDVTAAWDSTNGIFALRV